MTAKQQRLINNLSPHKTIMQSATEVGYSPKARSMYRKNTKAHIVEKIGNNPDKIIAEFENGLNEVKKNKDWAIVKTYLDSLARINAMFSDRIINEHKDSVPDTLKAFLDDKTSHNAQFKLR